MDKLIHYVNLDGRVNVFYSTPAIFTQELYAANVSWAVKVRKAAIRGHPLVPLQGALFLGKGGCVTVFRVAIDCISECTRACTLCACAVCVCARACGHPLFVRLGCRRTTFSR